MNLFDIVGPTMVGPSSSHTAGAVRIGNVCRKLMGEPVKKAKIYFHGSFLATGKGHGTDKAIVAGLLGMAVDDERIPDSFEVAGHQHMEFTFEAADLGEVHSNTAKLVLTGVSGKELEVVAASVCGGRINVSEIDYSAADFSGEYPTLIIYNKDKPGLVAGVTDMLQHRSINIAAMQLHRSGRGGVAIMVIETDQEVWQDAIEQNIGLEEHFKMMRDLYFAMKSSDEKYDENQKSNSGLVGGEASKVHKRRMEGKLLCGDFCGVAMEKALRISESNACMKRFVAAPTAGSCGVVPAVLISFQEKENLDDDTMTKALYVAAGIGGVIASRASLSGAEGGCQAEIGSASAMAAGALCFLQGGDCRQICHAAALALKGLLGLACDPVGGLVEVPCVKRNVIGAINAVSSTDMVLAGIYSKIDPDQVIDAMKNIGRCMSPSIKETGLGGLAVTPEGREIAEKLAHNNKPE